MPERLFLPRRSMGLKDLEHTLGIIDCVLAIEERDPGATIKPCWAVRRKLGAGWRIPDCVIRSADRSRLTLVELDLGTERLSVLQAKLADLVREYPSWSGDADVSIVILTPKKRRATAIRTMLDRSGIVALVFLLTEFRGAALRMTGLEHGTAENEGLVADGT